MQHHYFAAVKGTQLDDVSILISFIANFSLDLLPSVLETKRASGVQTFAVDGYASIERKGNGLLATTHIHDKTELARDVWSLIKAGMLKAWSIGCAILAAC